MRDCRAKRWGGIVTIFLLSAAGGCAAQHPNTTSYTPPPAPEVLSADDYATIKASYMAANPTARVGRVVAVLLDQQRVAIGDVSLGDFHKGDVLSIVDPNLNSVADATVVDIDAQYLFLHYVPVSRQSPVPVVGDLAIRAALPQPAAAQ